MKLGFIGMGAMGSAIARGAVESGFVCPTDLFFTDMAAPGSNSLTQECGVVQLASNAELLAQCQNLVLAVKPKHLPGVLSEIEPLLEGQLVISIAGGVPLKTLEAGLPAPSAVIRVMPNINALVGEAMSAVCPGTNVTDAQLQYALDLFNAVGRAIELEEPLFGAFTAIAGCAPAWTYAYAEALAKAGVAAGLTKTQASQAAAQMLAGSAKMLQRALDDGVHPAKLVDNVCSPGGSTIAGLLAGEQAGFSAATVRMVQAAMEADARAAK